MTQVAVLALLTPDLDGRRAQAFAALRDRDDWRRAIAFATSIHSVLPFVLAVSREVWFSGLPTETQLECEKVLSRECMVLALLDHELECAAEVLTAARIPVIVLKGMDVGRRFYPERLLRPMGDVDLLVSKPAFHDAWRALLRAGFIQIEPCYPHGFRSSLARGKDLPSIDLHHGLLAGESNAIVEGYWQRSVPAAFKGFPTDLRVLCPEDCLVYMLRHSAVLHVLDSLVWLTDLHYLISSSRPDWDRVMAELRRTRAISAAAFVFEILLSNWQTPIPRSVRFELQQKMGILRSSTLGRRRELSAWYHPAGRTFWQMIGTRFLLRDSTRDAIDYGIRRWARKRAEARTQDQAATFSQQMRDLPEAGPYGSTSSWQKT